MKIGKRTAMLTSFIVGATIFASTAVADIISSNGYDELKSAAKYTAESCAGKLNSFTMETSGTVKNDDEVIAKDDSIHKYDNVNIAKESTDKAEYGNQTNNSWYNYDDKKCSIYKNPSDETNNVTEYSGNNDAHYMFDDPFKKDQEKDLEKILDALVGNLKDYAVVSKQNDGSKEISGSLTETQIPTIVNALISYEYKNDISHGIEYQETDKQKIEQLTDDIYLKEGKVKASINKDGLINNVTITGTISGKDKDGNQHNLTLEYLFKLYDVNSTVVNKPNLEGKKVKKTIVNENHNSQPIISKKCIGKYTNDIVADKDDKFIKVGERVLEITNADEKSIKGKYHEEYNKEYANIYKPNKDIDFDINVDKNNNSCNFTYIDEAGNKKQGNITVGAEVAGTRIYFDIDTNSTNGVVYNNAFSRYFDE